MPGSMKEDIRRIQGSDGVVGEGGDEKKRRAPRSEDGNERA